MLVVHVGLSLSPVNNNSWPFGKIWLSTDYLGHPQYKNSELDEVMSDQGHLLRPGRFLCIVSATY